MQLRDKDQQFQTRTTRARSAQARSAQARASHTQRGHTIRRTGAGTAACGAVALAAVATLTGCAGMAETFSDRWNVEYQVTATEGDLGSVQQIEYQHWATTLDRDARVRIPENSGESLGVSGPSWSEETIVGAGLDAKIRVEGATVPLSCKIVLEGKETVAESTAQPGEALECAATLPKFE